MVAVPNPGQIILLGDAANVFEDGGTTLWIDCGIPSQNFSKRHKGGANIAWLDGRVTWESGAQINAYRSQVFPNRSNWVPGE